MHEISRRDALRLLPGAALWLAGCRESRPVAIRTNRQPDDILDPSNKNQFDRYADSFQFPHLSIDKPVLASNLDAYQRASLDAIGIKQVSFQDSQDKKTQIRIGFNDNVEIGSTYTPNGLPNQKVPYPSFVIIWRSLPNGEKIANIKPVRSAHFEIDTKQNNSKSAVFEFDFQTLPNRSYVIIFNSDLIRVDGKKMPPTVIPFQFQIQDVAPQPIPQGPTI